MRVFMSTLFNSYGPTLARRHGTPGKLSRPQSLTLDIHSHVAIRAAGKVVAPYLNMSASPLVFFSSEETRAINQMQDRERTSRITQYDDRLADMDEAGLDMQLIMAPPGQCYYSVPLEISVEASRIVNEGLAEYVAGRSDRFLAIATIPMQDGKTAAEELEAVMKLPGMKGVQILTTIAGKELSDPDFEVFWTRAEQLGAVILIHPNGFTQGQRMSRHYYNNVIGNPLETTLAIHNLIFDGVLERHPNLKIIVVHGGGYAASYSGRMDHAWGARSDACGTLQHPPTTYLKRLYFDTVVFTNEQLEALVKVVGTDQIVMGTDYPFDMAESDPVGHVTGSDLDARTVEAICGGNAKRLLGM
jgi:aminocarboxymuconate-semialdehyde decarboxylase